MKYSATFSDGTTVISDESKSEMTHAWGVKIKHEGEEEGPIVSHGFSASEAEAELDRGKTLSSIKWKGPITFVINEIVPAIGTSPAEEAAPPKAEAKATPAKDEEDDDEPAPKKKNTR